MPTLYILYGSATGNAEQIAKDLSSKVAPKPFDKIVCLEMDKYKKHLEDVWIKNPKEEDAASIISKHGIILITSTTGNGDVPENASRFVRYIKRKTTIPKKPFQFCTYAVLGLGDTNYDNFCAAGKLLDRQIEILGGTRAKALACADEATGLEDVVEPFIETVFNDIVKSATTNTEKESNSNNNTDNQSEKVEAVAETVATTTNAKPIDRLVIVHGGELAQDVAEQIKTKKPSGSSIQIEVRNASERPKTLLDYNSNTLVCFVLQTIENAAPTEEGGTTVRFFKRKTHPDNLLADDKFQYCVLGVGDSNLLLDRQTTSAKDCNQVAQELDKRLDSLGGVRYYALGMADERTELTEVEPWIDGLMAKLQTPPPPTKTNSSQQQQSEPQPAAAVSEKASISNNNNNNKKSAPPPPLFIMYGSMTGNAEQIAKDLSATYEMLLKNPDAKCFFPSVTCCTLDQYKKDHLSKGKEKEQKNHAILIITSTTGNADPPENATRFLSYIKRQTKRDPPSTPFDGCTYAILALGDTNYDVFCAAGKNIDKYMSDCGGTRACPIQCADEATGLEDVVEPWTNTIFSIISNACRPNSNDVGSGSNDDNNTESTIATPLSNNNNNNNNNNDNNRALLQRQTDSNISSVTSTPSLDISSEEKKMDQQDISEQQVKSKGGSRSRGVRIMCSLLNVDPLSESSQSSSLVPTVDHCLLPTLGSCRSSCELITANDEQLQQIDDNSNRRRSRGMSFQDELDRLTISSASTSGIYYNQSKPYHTKILNARYLTKTKVDAAKDVCQNIGVDKLSDNESILQAMNIYDKHFPLQKTGDDKNNDTADDDIKYERNSKRVIEMTVALPDDYTLEYKPGDSIGFVVTNTPFSVTFVLDMLQKHHNIDRKQKVSIDASAHPITVEEAIRTHIDLCTPIKNKRLLHSLSHFATDYEEECSLRLLSSKTTKGEEFFLKYIDEQRMTIVDILRDFPSCQDITLQGLLSILPGIPPRYYSVSSSPLVTNNSLTVTYSVVDYLTPSLTTICGASSNSDDNIGRRRIGGIATRYLEVLCSPFLCSKDEATTGILLDKLPKLKVFPKPTAEFRMPDTLSTPLVLIGPGTGIAPFMGFLAHRKAQISTNTDAANSVVEGTWRGGFDMEADDLPISRKDSRGLNLAEDYKSSHQLVGDVDVFFGCRHADHDWLYREEMEAHRDDGIISNLYTAFSRDGPTANRTYVQDLMRNDEACGSRLSSLIVEDNASVYVCGDGNAMGRDVQSAVVDLIAKRKNISINEANKYLEKMKADNRFVLDIWTS